MNAFDHQFTFNDIIDGYSTVNWIKYPQTAPVKFQISIEDSSIRLLNGSCISSLQADLLDLAVAIHFADKFALPKKKRSINVRIDLPLRHPEIFSQNSQMLQNLLFWYTEDYWHFCFQNRKTRERKSERLPAGYLMPSDFFDFTEIALWSGGLDSLAGLQTRLLQRENRCFALIGTGSNNIMRKTQQQVFRTLHNLPHASGHLSFLHIPIKANYGNRYSQNWSHRARGIVFLLVGTVCALAIGFNKLHIYETGIGAINLPLPGGVGRDHSKAVHPISLIKIGDFISSTIGGLFSIENPFIFRTKAEMCNSFVGNPLPIFETISCDRLHREIYIQCGFCSSCLLRRQALAAAGIKDQTKYLIPHGRMAQQRHLSFWEKMNQQVNIIEKALNSLDPLSNLYLSYNDLPDIVSHMANGNTQIKDALEEKIIKLYRTYVQEWRSVGDSILDDMTHNKIYQDYLEDEKWQQMHLIN